MLKKMVFGFIICFSMQAISQDFEIIDLADLDPSTLTGYEYYDWEELDKIYTPFNRAMEFGPFFNFLKVTYQIDIAIETGTWKGLTTQFLGTLFNEVHSVEINPKFYKNVLPELEKYPNIKLHLGSSPRVLRKILPEMRNERVLFYLDAHWYSNWPLLNELEVISKTHQDNCIIAIDDFKVPGRNDIPFDHYQGKECSYEYIKNQLSKIYSSYKCYYVLPIDPAGPKDSRAKFVVIPSKWVEEELEQINWEEK